jgi:hypothetical protein
VGKWPAALGKVKGELYAPNTINWRLCQWSKSSAHCSREPALPVKSNSIRVFITVLPSRSGARGRAPLGTADRAFSRKSSWSQPRSDRPSRPGQAQAEAGDPCTTLPEGSCLISKP